MGEKSIPVADVERLLTDVWSGLDEALIDRSKLPMKVNGPQTLDHAVNAVRRFKLKHGLTVDLWSIPSQNNGGDNG